MFGFVSGIVKNGGKFIKKKEATLLPCHILLNMI